MSDNYSSDDYEVVADAKLPQGMVSARATGDGDFGALVQTKTHAWLMDEPESVEGGLGKGPNPLELMQASLASCTLMTMGMYARRKGVELGDTRASVTYKKLPALPRETKSHFTVVLEFDPQISPEYQVKLSEIARKCPVHKLLTGTVEVVVEEA